MIPRARHRLWLLRSMLAAAFLFSGTTIAYAQEDSPLPFVEWAKDRAIPLTSIEPVQYLDDLQQLKPIVGAARVVALGEGAHGVHEFLAFRNRLFEFLVMEMGFTAIAVETGFSEAIPIDDYVTGHLNDSTDVVSNVFSWTAPQAFRENKELVDWMRAYNTQLPTKRKIRFYGIDLTGGTAGEFTKSRRALDDAFAFLERIDSALAGQTRQTIERFLDRFNDARYHTLTSGERNTLTAGIDELIGLLERQRVSILNQASELEYQRACHNAVVARQLDRQFRVSPPADTTSAEFSREYAPAVMARDAGMADNVRWVLDQEGPQGRVFVFAHNWHVKKCRSDSNLPYPEFYPDPIRNIPTMMGEYLNSMLKSELVVLGFTCNQRPEDGTPADPTSIDGVLATLGVPLFVLGLDSVPDGSPIAQWLNRGRKIRVNDRYGELNVIKAFDALVFVDKTNPVGVIDH